VRNRGDRREAIFRADADREALLAAPAEACSKTARRRCQPPPDSLKKINMTLSRTDPFTRFGWFAIGVVAAVSGWVNGLLLKGFAELIRLTRANGKK